MKYLVNSVRTHMRRVRRDIFKDPLNRGYRVRLLRDYIVWHCLYKYRNRPWTIYFDNGFRSLVYPYPDHDAGEVNIWTRNVDWHDTQLVRKILIPGDTIIDAGCNVGNRTLPLCDIIGGALLIDAGEAAVARTLENLEINGLPLANFRVIHKAVGSSVGTAEFTNLGGASTLNRIITAGSVNDCTTIEIALTTIDHEVRNLAAAPAFIKIDVEGFDLEALRGAVKTLKSGSVRLVKFERNASESLESIYSFFAELNWSIFGLNEGGLISMDDAVIEGNRNLFACPTDGYRAIVASAAEL